MEQYNKRSDVPEKYKWVLTDFYNSDIEWENCYKKQENNILK